MLMFGLISIPEDHHRSNNGHWGHMMRKNLRESRLSLILQWIFSILLKWQFPSRLHLHLTQLCFSFLFWMNPDLHLKLNFNPIQSQFTMMMPSEPGALIGWERCLSNINLWTPENEYLTLFDIAIGPLRRCQDNWNHKYCNRSLVCHRFDNSLKLFLLQCQLIWCIYWQSNHNSNRPILYISTT